MPWLPPPIRRWRIRNFKSITRADIQLAPLTLLMGSNSSGKSSLIQSILLLVQAAQGRQLADSVPLNGPIVSLGRFDDVLSRWRGARKEIEIGATVSFAQDFMAEQGFPTTHGMRGRVFGHSPKGTGVGPELETDLDWDIALKGVTKAQSGSADIVSVKIALGQGPRVQLQARRREIAESDRSAAERGRRFRRPSYVPPVPFARGLEYSLNYVGTLKSEADQLAIRGLHMRAGVPIDALIPEQESSLLADEWISNLLWSLRSRPLRRGAGRSPDTVLDSPEPDDELVQLLVSQAVRDLTSEERRPARPASHQSWLKPPLDREVLQRLLPGTAFAEKLKSSISRNLRDGSDVAYVSHRDRTDNDFWNYSFDLLNLLRDRVLYLGPLRQDPQVVYKTLPLQGPGNLGSKGELTAAVLEAFADFRVQVPMPGEGELKQTTLRIAVDRWMHELGVADHVQTSSRGAMGLAIEVERPGPKGKTIALDLTGVGVGVSQLLPVVVMSLLAVPGSVLLFEQPELHLHPAVQQKLGDFFIALAMSGRQVIVESHSEYLLSRLRLRIAEDPTDQTSQLMTVLFAAFTSTGTHFNPVTLNKYGAIEEWPDGFFDQGPRESAEILKAALAKRSQGRSSG